MAAARDLGLAAESLELLACACAGHSQGGLEAKLSVQVCWDADRISLARIGIQPSAERLCTPAAREAG